MSGLRANQLALVAGLVERRQRRDAGLRPQDRQPGRRRLRFCDRRRRQRHRRQSPARRATCSSSCAPKQSGASLRRPAGVDAAAACSRSTARRASPATLETSFNQLVERGAGGCRPAPTSSRRGSACSMRRSALAQQLNEHVARHPVRCAARQNGLNSAVSTANNAMTQIAKLNAQLQGTGYTNDAAAAAAGPARPVCRSAVAD